MLASFVLFNFGMFLSIILWLKYSIWCVICWRMRFFTTFFKSTNIRYRVYICVCMYVLIIKIFIVCFVVIFRQDNLVDDFCLTTYEMIFLNNYLNWEIFNLKESNPSFNLKFSIWVIYLFTSSNSDYSNLDDLTQIEFGS